MKRYREILIAVTILTTVQLACAQAPVITSFHANGELTWTSSVADAAYRIEWAPSLSGGSWTSTWDGLDWIGPSTATVFKADVPMFYRVVMLTNWIPENSVEIPGGPFLMGDMAGGGESWEIPVHTVTVSRFFVSKYEVTKELWSEVHNWAVTNGYHFDNTGVAAGPQYPISAISWYDCVKWCNARSEKESLLPVYYTSATMATVYRSNQLDLANSSVNWDATGYRLPTEAEWEKACRAGTTNRFFCGDDVWTLDGYAWHPDNSGGNHHEVAQKNPNPWGLHDTHGNVREWCWDWFAEDWYSQGSASDTDTRGPASGSARVLRGGDSIANGPTNCSSSARSGFDGPHEAYGNFGLRCVRSHVR